MSQIRQADRLLFNFANEAVSAFKWCKTCNSEKLLSSFYWRKARSTPYTKCDDCRLPEARSSSAARYSSLSPHEKWARWLWNGYRITPEKFNTLLASQNGKCPVCFDQLPERPWIDHDHSCCPGRTTCGNCVRGLLHPHCNSLLGLANDDPARLVAAAEYLSNSRRERHVD